jgi:hypothetical protein
MQLFVLSNHCKSEAHCATCRDLEGDGRRWRKNLTKYFLLPDDNIDFECPYGKKWNNGAVPQGRMAAARPRIASAAVQISDLATPPAGGCNTCGRKKK